LNALGVKTIVVEMGVGMRITPEYGKRLFDGILNLMKNIGMWTGEVTAEIVKPRLVEDDSVDFVNAEKSGVFLPEKQYGAILQSGDIIGRIVNPLTGQTLSVARAAEKGLLMTIRAYPIVYEGSLLARIIRN
ncbi:MAG: succinylglutamate desuccinylase/aspartoacylase family protein, partial [Bacteroidales bacterium]|nr:succinylglutamate desuccinylase/aspartoacylase family protein [Bacteroidales bacterium]